MSQFTTLYVVQELLSAVRVEDWTILVSRILVHHNIWSTFHSVRAPRFIRRPGSRHDALHDVLSWFFPLVNPEEQVSLLVQYEINRRVPFLDLFQQRESD